jgi:hypothetical protein
MGFLKMLTSLHTRLAVEKRLANGEVSRNGKHDGVRKMTRKNSGTINIQKRRAIF